MKKLDSPDSGTAQVEVESPLGSFCSEVAPRQKGGAYRPLLVEPWDEDKWRREARARDLFEQYLQHDIDLGQ